MLSEVKIISYNNLQSIHVEKIMIMERFYSVILDSEKKSENKML